MTSDNVELHAILERISRLEVQNRRLKKIGMTIFTIFFAIIIMGQTAPSPRVVEAQRFILKDSEGNVRGWMGTIGKGSEFTLGNINAQPMIRLIVSTDSSDLHFFGSHKSGMNLGLDSGYPDISMTGAEGNGGVKITFTENGPNFTLEDARGFSTIVGSTQQEKAMNRKAGVPSAASVILLDKDKQIIWQTP